MSRPVELEARECVDRNIRLIDPPVGAPPRAPEAVFCEVCGVVLSGIVHIVGHYQFEHTLERKRSA